MDKKNSRTYKVLRGIIFVVLIMTTLLALVTVSNNIVIGKIDSTIVYSNENLIFIKVLLIGSLLINILFFINIFYKEEMFYKTKLISFLALLIIYFITLLKFDVKYDKYNMYTFGFMFANIILLITLLINDIFKKYNTDKIDIKTIAEGSVMAALGIVLSLISKMIPILELPQGGSFSLSMLPLFIFALRRGPKAGLIMGIVYSIVNLITDGFILHWGSLFFDYLIPFGMLSLIAGLFSKKAQEGHLFAVILAVLLGSFVRYICHGLSGVIFFSEYADGQNVWLYSFVIYNLPYMLVSTIGVVLTIIPLTSRLIYLDTRIK